MTHRVLFLTLLLAGAAVAQDSAPISLSGRTIPLFVAARIAMLQVVSLRRTRPMLRIPGIRKKKAKRIIKDR